MNYIRGAVNAISAPYHYYKDLPPINPSTLTGAIDVIVIQRPTDHGDTELACSPFHVRFGKWQVLRPGEKKVNVFVNGNPIPFNMKIGEAGEAFFVFETDDEVPADLITSPILQPTRPDAVATADVSISADDLDATQGPSGSEHIQSGKGDGKTDELRKKESDSQEPEFLDLDALPSPPQEEDEAFRVNDTTPKHLDRPPPSKSLPSHVSIPLPLRPAQLLPSPPLTPTQTYSVHNTEEMLAQDKRVDEAILAAKHNFLAPEVEYHHNIALDAEGYHAHRPEPSDHTVIAPRQSAFPSSSTPRTTTPSPVHEMSHSQPHRPSHVDGLHVFPAIRALSEPPPDGNEHDPEQLAGPSSQNRVSPPSPLSISLPTQEYSWEWGAFPQPSPMKTTFGKGGRSWAKGKGKAGIEIAALSSAEVSEETQEREGEHEHGRSHSVPPELDGSPSKKRKHRELPDTHETFDRRDQVGDLYEEPFGIEDIDAALSGFGKGGKLEPSPSDSARFILSIDDREMSFELSLIPHVEGLTSQDGSVSDPEESGEPAKVRGRRNRYGGPGGAQKFGTLGDMEAARLFLQGKIDFYRFLDDDDIVDDPRLVVRWASDRYVTRDDGSPVMRALVAWRDSALRQRAKPGVSPSGYLTQDDRGDVEPSLPTSGEHEQVHDRQHHTRSKSEPPEKLPGKRTSSWVQWWNRGRRGKASAPPDDDLDNDISNDKTTTREGKVDRPPLREMSSAPVPEVQAKVLPLDELLNMKLTRDIPHAQSAPALPSTPVQTVVKDSIVASIPLSPESSKRKFAKTLRLTSEQLKALNLKPGANTITFSLSTSGAIACTARIFVWDSTDLVVVSDIDGTITKSDGLGHVFAMIGRDWTHLGVAKLYTDIRRNGYKVMYLTSRAIGQADATRDYLKGIKQNDYQLPEGPVIMSPDRLMASLHREVIMRKPEVFKMACLRDIQRLFGEASRNPFYAGFGNRITDALSYRSVNVPSARVFTIDSSGEVKMELLELAGYKSSYIHMTDLVDQMFPPIHRKWAPEFTDFNYWKTPVQDFPLPDLSPPSPALSARSDTSNRSTLARLRNFSLVSRQSPQRLAPSLVAEDPEMGSFQLRQMSSFEKLGNTLGFGQTTSMNGRRSTSPASSRSYDDSEDEDDLELGADGGYRRRERRRSMTSMPGTLDEMHFGMDDDDESPFTGHEGEEEDDLVSDDDVGNEAFDEDLLAAGEMKNVPFL